MFVDFNRILFKPFFWKDVFQNVKNLFVIKQKDSVFLKKERVYSFLEKGTGLLILIFKHGCMTFEVSSDFFKT